ncbi:leucyl aminopeptidase [Microbacterium insulae]|uniref:Probable cytosol aminopeptidase n=1 Tax=Microbacterium insulae TaxID=483014 RepID=A0ABW3AHM5_9MICO
MNRVASKLIPADFPALPGLAALDAVDISVSAVDDGITSQAIGYPAYTTEDAAPAIGLSREAYDRAGFAAEVGQTLVVPRSDAPDVVAVGFGGVGEETATSVRDAAAAFARACARHSTLALVLPSAGTLDAATAIAAAAEGILLARYRYTALQASPKGAVLTSVVLIHPEASTDPAIHTRLERAIASARAAAIARDLANTPPGHLTATDMGAVAVDLGARFGFDVELFDEAALIELGCGGLLGVNRGSAEPPLMIKLGYRPDRSPTGHLGMIGKGIMYDSGGISLKPSDPMHLLMKMDMGGAAAVLGAFCGLRSVDAGAHITGWLMCTDNMPSGTAYKLGDVLTARGGTTIEVKNTDAEGRLVMADAFVLAGEEGVDAVIDVATLTGAALMALGTARAPLFANDDALAQAVLDAAETVDEPLWRMPLERKYRTQLDSDIADISNLGGRYAGATTAALFLEHFAGTTPWAHIDIAGTMQSESDDAWRPKGATGFGARLLLETASRYSGPQR